MEIYSAVGNGGFGAKVDSKNRLATISETVSDLESTSQDGKLWSLPIEGVVTAGAATVFYMKNLCSDELHIADLNLYSSAAVILKIYKVSGTPVGGTAVIAGNRHTGKGTKPDATILAGNAITGLTNEELIAVIGISANSDREFCPPSHFQIQGGTAIAITVSAAATLNGMMTAYMEDAV